LKSEEASTGASLDFKKNKTMKKIIFLSIFLLSGSILLSGCTDKTVDSSGDQVRRGDMSRPDFGQPDRPADLRGLVKSVVGNEVTILKIERPQEGEEGEFQRTGDDNGEERAASFGGITGGRIPGMGGGIRGGSGGGDRDEDAMIEMMKSRSSGEEKILVPVGIQMLAPESSEIKAEMIEANIADIKNDKMIQIWLNEDVNDRNIAEFVLITR
jgi:hypothetical protein